MGVIILFLRDIKPQDNVAIKNIIQTTLTEFGNNIPGTAYYDPELDTLAEFYNSQPDKAHYWVIEHNNQILGGGGLAPLNQAGVAELQKLYFLPEARGYGFGKKIINLVEENAKKMGYTSLYLETFKNLSSAVHLYQKFDFQEIPQPLSGTAHSACDMWFIKKL